ncbi:hypothetical protein JD76_01369 [Micromonospora endolithica]|nr:hypothetical protein JD76_01369 [Micromonospora endolithica]
MSAVEFRFRPGAGDDELMARHPGPGGGGGNLCFRPGDDGDELVARHGGIGGGGYACFHPGDNEPVAQHRGPGGGGGTCCFHPGDEGGAPMARLADDLATDLHLALTSIDDRHLAVLA